MKLPAGGGSQSRDFSLLKATVYQSLTSTGKRLFSRRFGSGTMAAHLIAGWCSVPETSPGVVNISAISEGMRGYALDPNSVEAPWKKSEELVDESF